MIKGKGTFRRFSFFILILFIYLLTYSGDVAHIQLISIHCPRILEINGSENNLINEFEFTLHFRYFGKDIVSNTRVLPKEYSNKKAIGGWGSYSFMANYSVEGKILFFDKNGDILTNIVKYYRKTDSAIFEDVDFNSRINHLRIFFVNKGEYSKDFRIFMLKEINKEELLNMIDKKKISKISLYLKKMIYSLALDSENSKKEKSTKKVEFSLDINRTFEINVLYGGKKNFRGIAEHVGIYAKNLLEKKLANKVDEYTKYIIDFLKRK